MSQENGDLRPKVAEPSAHLSTGAVVTDHASSVRSKGFEPSEDAPSLRKPVVFPITIVATVWVLFVALSMIWVRGSWSAPAFATMTRFAMIATIGCFLVGGILMRPGRLAAQLWCAGAVSSSVWLVVIMAGFIGQQLRGEAHSDTAVFYLAAVVVIAVGSWAASENLSTRAGASTWIWARVTRIMILIATVVAIVISAEPANWSTATVGIAHGLVASLWIGPLLALGWASFHRIGAPSLGAGPAEPEGNPKVGWRRLYELDEPPSSYSKDFVQAVSRYSKWVAGPAAGTVVLSGLWLLYQIGPQPLLLIKALMLSILTLFAASHRLFTLPLMGITPCRQRFTPKWFVQLREWTTKTVQRKLPKGRAFAVFATGEIIVMLAATIAGVLLAQWSG